MTEANTARKPPNSEQSSIWLRPFETVKANFKLMRARKLRVGPNASVDWRPVLECTAIMTTLVICSFALLDQGIALQRGQMPTWVAQSFQSITRFGKSDWILYPSGIALIALLFIKTRALSQDTLFRLYQWNIWLSFIFLGVGMPYLTSTILKLAIGRPRPSEFVEYGLVGFHPFAFDASFASFPSGHSTTIGAFALVMALLLPKFRAVFAIMALLIGFSRVGVGAHHPSDVFAGLAIGAILAFLVAKWFAARGLLFLSLKSNWPQLRPSMQLFRQIRR